MQSLALLLLAGSALAQQPGFQCPSEDGYYPDPYQCDLYYECRRGVVKEDKLCPDGLVFDQVNSPKEFCNYPFLVECPEGSVQQEPKPSVQCPRQNGYFEHEDPNNCKDYYQCTGGSSQKLTCHKGLVFDEFTGSCVWESLGYRTGCLANIVTVLADGFSCNNSTQLTADGSNAYDHTRHAKPDGDCRFYYVCENGVTPREVGCPRGTAFNDDLLICDDPANVPGCEDLYAGEDLPFIAQVGAAA